MALGGWAEVEAELDEETEADAEEGAAKTEKGLLKAVLDFSCSSCPSARHFLSLASRFGTRRLLRSRFSGSVTASDISMAAPRTPVA